MKSLLNVLLLIAFSLCFFEWGGNNTAFLIEMEWDVFSDSKKRQAAIFHPLILIGIFGQLLIFAHLFIKNKPKSNILGLVLLGLIVLLVTLAGLLGMRLKMVLSTLPFWFVAFLLIRHLLSEKKKNEA